MNSSSWDRLMKPEGREIQFDGHERMAPFDPGTSEYSPVNAWWLSELCRLVYTPDFKERGRIWHRHKTDREHWLGDRTPFAEAHSFHKTGSHAAIFRVEPEECEPFTVLCFRGTNKLRQWIMNLAALPARWERTGNAEKDGEKEASVHQGFKILFDRIWPQIEPCLAEMPQPVFYTGHSLGGAFASMAALVRRPSALYTFGSPRVGNRPFAEKLKDTVPAHYRIVNARDVVPLLPDDRDPDGPNHKFAPCGRTVHLDREPDGAKNIRETLRNLAKTIGKSSDPPDCIIDHLSISYSKKLREEALSSRI